MVVTRITWDGTGYRTSIWKCTSDISRRVKLEGLPHRSLEKAMESLLHLTQWEVRAVMLGQPTLSATDVFLHGYIPTE